MYLKNLFEVLQSSIKDVSVIGYFLTRIWGVNVCCKHVQKFKFSLKDFFSKCDQIRRHWSFEEKKESLMTRLITKFIHHRTQDQDDFMELQKLINRKKTSR